MARRIALLSLHTHGDRSFIDDQRLALWSGLLRDAGLENDLLVAALDPALGTRDPAYALLDAALRDCDVAIFDRLWDYGLVASLRASHPGLRFVWCKNEHRLDDPPADLVVEDDQERVLPAVVAFLRGERANPPPAVKRVSRGLALPLPPAVPVEGPPPRYAPNLHPRVLTPDRIPPARSFSLMGNRGCPYQSDARENPLYAGVELPAGTGRGCAFCTTGNDYVPRPNPETAADVLAQLRYVRREAPELDRLVLKDQNPFGYLTELLESVARERLGPFSLLLETRADWFLRSRTRFEQALAHARDAAVRVSPYLVGIENFSQPELDRMNKGTSAELNERFLEALRAWKASFGDALSLDHASFGFILFTPWTTLADLRTNLDAIRRTRFDEFRGSLLSSRARLYPDTALFHLARRDGLLAERFESDSQDGSRRYGYHEAAPWRFRDPVVARLAELGARLSEERGHRDQPALLEGLLRVFETSPSPSAVTPEEVRAQLDASGAAGRAPPVSAAETAGIRRKFVELVRPLSFDEPFEGGWRFGPLAASQGKLRVELLREGETPLVVEFVSGNERGYARSRHYAIRHVNASVSPSQRAALDRLCRVVVANDAPA